MSTQPETSELHKSPADLLPCGYEADIRMRLLVMSALA